MDEKWIRYHIRKPLVGSAITSLLSAPLAGRWVQEWWWSTGQQFSTEKQQLFISSYTHLFCFTAVFWASIWKFAFLKTAQKKQITPSKMKRNSSSQFYIYQFYEEWLIYQQNSSSFFKIRLEGLAKFVSWTLPHTTLSRHFCFPFSSVLTSLKQFLALLSYCIEIFFLGIFTVLLLEILHAFKQPMSKKIWKSIAYLAGKMKPRRGYDFSSGELQNGTCCKWRTLFKLLDSTGSKSNRHQTVINGYFEGSVLGLSFQNSLPTGARG